jgi:hypothetical protein
LAGLLRASEHGTSDIIDNALEAEFLVKHRPDAETSRALGVTHPLAGSSEWAIGEDAGLDEVAVLPDVLAQLANGGALRICPVHTRRKIRSAVNSTGSARGLAALATVYASTTRSSANACAAQAR